MEERDNTPLLDLNVSLDEQMFDNGLDCVPHSDTEMIDEHILYGNGDLVETSKDMTTDYIPKVGMLFESEDELYKFYNYYARRKGFSIRKGHFKRSGDGEIKKRVIHCSKEGFKQRHKRGTPQKERPVLRTGCMALIQVTAKDGMFVVTKFVQDHNHELVLAEEAHLLRSQKGILPQQARYIESLHSGGCGPTKAFSILSKEHDGPQNLNFTLTDCKNHFQKRRREIYKDGDAQVALNYFRAMKKENPAFSYEVQVDNENKACNLFWADARSKIDYGFFGDVVCFDTTFKTNKYGMPCAPFVGVNHHGMSVLFGIALLVDESAESFVWAFESFLSAMSGKHPATIFTDQAQAIGNAVKEVMPDTHHHLCLWHIFQNAAKHLSHVYAANEDFSKDFAECLYSAETEEEFESMWTSMLIKYSLTDNDWLIKLYAKREKWDPVYGREHFCAGMTTTQRSESVNSFVKGYVNRTLCINDFILQHKKAVMDWREKELQADYQSKHSKPVFISHLRFEREAAKMYTRKVFTIFQKQLKKFGCYLDKIEDENDEIAVHKVEIVSPLKNDKDRKVWFNKKENTVECSCNGFKFTGMLCVHALRVLLSRRILEIPSKYFLKRWSMLAKDGFIIDNSGAPILADCNESSSVRYSDLAHISLTVAMDGSVDEGSSSIVKRHLASCAEELKAYKISLETAAQVDESELLEQQGKVKSDERRNIDGQQIAIQDPNIKKNVRGEKNTKYKNAIDQSFAKKNGKKSVASKKKTKAQ